MDDLIAAMIALMNSSKEIIGPINIGNPNEFSISDLVSEVVGLTGSKSKVVQLPLPEDDPRRRQPDRSKAVNLLGWAPKIELKEGLQKTIDYSANSGKNH